MNQIGQSLRLKREIARRKSKIQRFLYIGHEVIKLFMLNSTENEISNAHKTKMLTIEDFFLLVVSIMLINVKMSTIGGILTFMSMINFIFIWIEHDKSFIVLGPGSDSVW